MVTQPPHGQWRWFGLFLFTPGLVVGLAAGPWIATNNIPVWLRVFPPAEESSQRSNMPEEWLDSYLVDLKLRQGIEGLVLENRLLEDQLDSANEEIRLYKGEIDNAHNRLITTKDNLTQTEYQVLTLSQCMIDLALLFDALTSFSDDIMAGNLRAITLNSITVLTPLQNSLVSWRYGTCTEARQLAETHRAAGKL